MVDQNVSPFLGGQVKGLEELDIQMDG